MKRLTETLTVGVDALTFARLTALGTQRRVARSIIVREILDAHFSAPIEPVPPRAHPWRKPKR